MSGRTDLALRPTVFSSGTWERARDLRVETMKEETCSDGSIQERMANFWRSAVDGWENGRTERISVGFILTTRFKELTAMVLRASIMDSLVAGMDPSMCSITLTRVLSPFK